MLVLAILVFSAACSPSKKNEGSKTGVPESVELYNEIAHMDSVMFDAFNAHDLEKLKTTFSENLEFFHDKGGLSGYGQTMNNFKSLFEKNQHTGLRRDLVKGSLEVYPIKDYGAVEICLHRFCHFRQSRDKMLNCAGFKLALEYQHYFVIAGDLR